MKADRDYSYVMLCPATGAPISWTEHAYSKGVCPRCGHQGKSTFTHDVKVSGKWIRPSLLEWLTGKRKSFRPDPPSGADGLVVVEFKELK